MKTQQFSRLAKVLGLVAAISAANVSMAVTITVADLIGTVVPFDGPPLEEATDLNFLIVQYNGGAANGDVSPGPTAGSTYVLAVGANVPAPLLPLITLPPPENKVEDPAGSIDITGWTYMSAKFGHQEAHYYIGGLSGLLDVDNDLYSPFPSTAGGLSHISFFNRASVPDGGATAALLGLGLVALGLIRRKI
jgi:hypothetical protein